MGVKVVVEVIRWVVMVFGSCFWFYIGVVSLGGLGLLWEISGVFRLRKVIVKSWV